MITAAHNVRNARLIEVYSEDRSIRAHLIGADGQLDIAVLRLDGASAYYLDCTNIAKQLPPFRSSVKSIGYPKGHPIKSVRFHQVRSWTGVTVATDSGWLRGSSGGALSYKGECIGILSRVQIDRFGLVDRAIPVRSPTDREFLIGSGIAVAAPAIRVFLARTLGGVPRSGHQKPATKLPVPKPPEEPPKEIAPSSPESQPANRDRDPKLPLPIPDRNLDIKTRRSSNIPKESGIPWATIAIIAVSAAGVGIPAWAVAAYKIAKVAKPVVHATHNKRHSEESDQPDHPTPTELNGPFTITHESVPTQPQVVTQNHYERVPIDDFRKAFEWAEVEFVRKYPGGVDAVETLKSFITQYLASQGKKGVSP